MLGVYAVHLLKWSNIASANEKLLGQRAETLVQAGFGFRDLNKNGRLDPYEDSRQPVEVRIENLLHQMSLEEKVALMFIDETDMLSDGSLFEKPKLNETASFSKEINSTLIARKKINHVFISNIYSAESMINWNNNMQAMAERTRLGIPITIASNLKHFVDFNASNLTPIFSRWCAPLGFASINDTLLMREFGEIVRQECLATGIRLILPQTVDSSLDIESQNIIESFGDDPKISSSMTRALIFGLQANELDKSSIAYMAKIQKGYNSQKPWGTNDTLNNRVDLNNYWSYLQSNVSEATKSQFISFDNNIHIQKLENRDDESPRDIIKHFLRDSLKFDGVICSKWGSVTNDKTQNDIPSIDIKSQELIRVENIIEAGYDMIGGESSPSLLIDLINQNKISEDRIVSSCWRILRIKFEQGLFDDPYLDIERFNLLPNHRFRNKGVDTQRKSLVLLKNENNILPLDESKTIFLDGLDRASLSDYRSLMTNIQKADHVILKLNSKLNRINSDSTAHIQGFPFEGKEKEKIMKLLESKSVVTIISLDRPLVNPDIVEKSKAVIADFCSKDQVILDLIYGKYFPSGKLPIELPYFMFTSSKQKLYQASDLTNPIFPIGYGLTYN